MAAAFRPNRTEAEAKAHPVVEADIRLRLAEYRCLSCGHKWAEQVPKIQPSPPFKTGADPCPKCGHLYVKWTNFEKDFAK